MLHIYIIINSVTKIVIFSEKKSKEALFLLFFHFFCDRFQTITRNLSHNCIWVVTNSDEIQEIIWNEAEERCIFAPEIRQCSN